MDMLALTDAALARLCIGATRIDPRRRRRWLLDVARKLEGEANVSRSPAARRQARVRARRRNGLHVYKLELRDAAVEGLISMMIASGELAESQSLDHRVVEAKLAALLEAQGVQWAR
jgi:hypothetical protein